MVLWCLGEVPPTIVWYIAAAGGSLGTKPNRDIQATTGISACRRLGLCPVLHQLTSIYSSADCIFLVLPIRSTM